MNGLVHKIAHNYGPKKIVKFDNLYVHVRVVVLNLKTQT